MPIHKNYFTGEFVKKIVLLIILLCFRFLLIADSSGIEEQNYRLSISGYDSEIGNSLSLSGSARFPVADYTGISLNAGLAEFNGKNSYVDSSGQAIGMDIFFRKYDLGIIQAGYNYGKSQSDIGSSTFRNDSQTYSLNATYYIENFDILLARSKSDFEIGESSNTSTMGISYYINDIFRAGVSAGGMDTQDSYSLGATYQPEIFNNDIGISAGYGFGKGDASYTISLSYYFGTRVSLLDRIRKY